MQLSTTWLICEDSTAELPENQHPLFPFPPGANRGGGFPPRRKIGRLPPRGASNPPAEFPLLHPPAITAPSVRERDKTLRQATRGVPKSAMNAIVSA